MRFTVFVDGQAGTTGLKINERLANRPDLEILKIEPEKRKDPEARRSMLNEADVSFLCLPDEAARESVSLVNNPKARIIDASTAHRTHPEWVYGLPELNKNQRDKIRASTRISVPGCHATGFNLILYPLVSEEIISRDYPISSYSVAGYSGGGKKMIAGYEAPNRDGKLAIPRLYSLQLNHKHIPEMQKIPDLAFPPLFAPIVADFYNGEVVSIPLFPRLFLKKMTAKNLQSFLASYYALEPFVKIMPYEAEAELDDGFLGATECNDTNRIEIFVFGQDDRFSLDRQEDRILISARFDNLGKGSSGAAIQNMNIILGIDEGTGLE
jgi:N-acetyl-gamma-glutamyl-phosphate reductase